MGASMSGSSRIIDMKDVTVTQGGARILESVTLTVDQGEFAAVLGPNGAGKTTLLRVVLGLIMPDSGSVTVFGKPPSKLGSMRAKIGYVPQIHSIDLSFPVTVFQTALMGTYGRAGLGRRPTSADKAAAAAALQKVGIQDLAERPIARLSGGQRQRVFIARALVNNPELLMLDEPTTGVDAAASGSLYTLLRELKDGGVTVVLVSHDVSVVAAYLDTVACLNHTLVAHGRPEEVAGSKALRQMYGCDVAYFHHGQAPHIVVEDH